MPKVLKNKKFLIYIISITLIAITATFVAVEFRAKKTNHLEQCSKKVSVNNLLDDNNNSENLPKTPETTSDPHSINKCKAANTAENYNNTNICKKLDDKQNSENSTKGIDFSNWNNSCDASLIIVNKDNELPSNFNPNLSNAKGIFNNLNSVMISDLQNMFSDAKKAGVNLFVSSGYRSISCQQSLFDKKVSYFVKKGYSKTKAEIAAARVVAKPKTSEHNTGLAIDLNGVKDDFYKTKEFKWLMENASNYGFVLRYPKDKIEITNVIFEPWHFRYVGVEHAKEMVSKNMCLEEYINFLINK